MKNILTFIFVAIVSISLNANNVTELLLRAEQAIEEEEYEIALEYYNQAIELAPQNAVAYYLRGIFNFEETDDDLALNDFNKAIELGFDKIDIYYHRGLAYESLVEYENAINDLTIFLNHKSKKTDEMLISSYETRGWCNYDLGNYPEALKDYSKVIEIDPMQYGPHNIIAKIYLNTERFEKAIEQYYKMLKLFPAKKNNIRAQIVVVKVNAGDFEGAINDCTQLIQEGYARYSVYTMRGLAYLGIKEYQLALDDANTSIEKYRITSEACYIKAKANFGFGNLQVALNQINEALKLYPENEIYLKNKDLIEKAISEKK
jgi:tetratricopeptide (TPR) repeat protein